MCSENNNDKQTINDCENKAIVVWTLCVCVCERERGEREREREREKVSCENEAFDTTELFQLPNFDFHVVGYWNCFRPTYQYPIKDQ